MEAELTTSRLHSFIVAKVSHALNHSAMEAVTWSINLVGARYSAVFPYSWLIEVNASPSLTASNKEDYDLKYGLLDDVLNVIDMENRYTCARYCLQRSVLCNMINFCHLPLVVCMKLRQLLLDILC